ncbi:hypothetical protein QGM71_05050 [Virgibacillus sp. C22-A2]|uniref:Uncharacterized protein n=1 Tax=Virgibacillus tibetensis TaxID=3042313 RepID=A0ABU6KCK6_9BACI|nr:hypothetical protein [Virgibacillus sp. C22-A2]
MWIHQEVFHFSIAISRRIGGTIRLTVELVGVDYSLSFIHSLSPIKINTGRTTG